jgi:hypothetical protein
VEKEKTSTIPILALTTRSKSQNEKSHSIDSIGEIVNLNVGVKR